MDFKVCLDLGSEMAGSDAGFMARVGEPTELVDLLHKIEKEPKLAQRMKQAKMLALIIPVVIGVTGSLLWRSIRKKL